MRRKILKLSGNFLHLLLGPGDHRGYRVIKGAIPKDAHIVGLHYDFYTDSAFILLESEEFDVVAADTSTPEFEIMAEVLPEIRTVIKLT